MKKLRKLNILSNKIFTCLLISLVVVGALTITVCNDAKKNIPQWVKDNVLIAHAFGGINGDAYSNSLDAFLNNYNSGYRVFETDLVFTRDDVLVARHDWYPFEDPTLAEVPLSYGEFVHYKIYGKYTTMSFEDIANLMHKYRDMYLVTDTKKVDKKDVINDFKAIYNTAKKVDISILDRIIPQIYDEDMLSIVKSVYDFNDIIYTLYQSTDSDDEVIKFSVQNGITEIAMPLSRCNKDFLGKLKKNNIVAYTHTVNTMKELNKYKQEGIYGFYTDFITPNDLKQ